MPTLSNPHAHVTNAAFAQARPASRCARPDAAQPRLIRLEIINKGPQKASPLTRDPKHITIIYSQVY